MVVYIDVLLCVNFLLDYFLILIVCRFTRERKRRGRFAAAAALGSLFSLTILLPQSAMLSLAIKLLGCGAMSAVAFGLTSAARFFRSAVWLFISCALSAGAFYALSQSERGSAFAVNNLSVYADINPFGLVIAVISVYLLLCVSGLLFKRPDASLRTLEIAISHGTKRVRASGMLDTGNKLRDPVSGRSAIVLCERLVARLLEPKQLFALRDMADGKAPHGEDLPRCAKLLAFTSLGGAGIAAAFEADSCEITRENGEKICVNEPLIALAQDRMLGEAECIVPGDILEEEYVVCKRSENKDKAVFCAPERPHSGKRGDILHKRSPDASCAAFQGGGGKGVRAAAGGLARGEKHADNP